MNQTTLSCEWCGKFVVSFHDDRESATGKTFEIFTDESGRLVKDENEAFAVAGEHKCKVICGACGTAVIMEQGKIYDRPAYDESKSLTASDREVLLYRRKSSHSCRTISA